MGQTVNKIHTTVDGVARDLNVTMTAVTNTINDLRRDASGTIASVTNECVQSLHIITQRTDETAFLLTNAVLATAAAIALAILLHLTHFSPFLRAIVWTMYASLCFHMIMTYIRHSRSRIPPSLQQPPSQSQPAIEHRQQETQSITFNSENPTEITLKDRTLTDEDVTIVITQIISNQECKKLRLINNNITPIGASILATALLDNKTLEQLSLWNNQVGDIGVESLADILSMNENILKKLDLSENNVTDEGACCLADMLKKNKTLTHLSLSSNNISNKGLQSLASALQKQNNTLQVLSLTENGLLTDECIDSLINMLNNNRSLKKLWINKCDLSQASQDKLRKATKSKKDFELNT